MTQWLIFTDLDGSLLDHDDYSYAPAEKILGKLKEDHTPVIFTTSKTRAEVLKLRKEMKNHDPFIIENGAAVLIPTDYFPTKPEGCKELEDYWVYSFSPTREHWLELIERAKTETPQVFNHFANMADEEIATATGLTVEEAKLANSREYSEPIQWLADEPGKQAFVDRLESMGGTVLQGGRFLSLSGEHNKGTALSWLVEQFLAYSIPCDLKTLALGDSQNDVAMLEAADEACVIRSPSHPPPNLKRGTPYLISEHFGPKGWAQGVKQFIYK